MSRRGTRCFEPIARNVLISGGPVRVALFPSAFHPSLGGVEELSLRLAQALTTAGHAVRVYTERWPRYLAASELVEGIEVRRFAFRVPGARGWKPKVSWASAYLRTNAALRRNLRDFTPSLLHVQCVGSAVDYALPAARALGVPFVVTLQGELSMDAAGIYQRPGSAQRRMRRALAGADAITACSHQTLDEAEQFFIDGGGRPFGSRGRVVYNGIDLASFSDVQARPHIRPYVFALGRLVRQKGFDLLIEAMRTVSDSHDLLLAGSGPEESALRQLVEDRGLKDHVVFCGRLDSTAVRQSLLGAALFVLPSRHEPFGIVNLEAMASGIPVVAARVGGVPEFVEDGRYGTLVEPENAAALAAAVASALGPGRAAAAKMAEAAQKRSADFDWNAIREKYLSVYRAIEVGADAAEHGRQPEGVMDRP